MKKILMFVVAFLAFLKVSAVTTFVVNTTNTGGWHALNPGSLPWALNQVNTAGAGTYVIQITAAGACDGSADDPASYVLTNSNVTIDATAAAGYACGKPTFFLKGPAYSFFSISGNNVTVKGMGITQFSLNVTGTGFKMFGCWLGLTAAGTAISGAAPGPSYSLSLTGGTATVGYSAACGRNVFSMSGVTNSVVVTGNNNIVNGNYFSTGSNGTSRLITGTQVSGSVLLVQGNNNTIDSNVVLGSSGGGSFGGITVNGASSAININHNYIGLNASGGLSNGAAGYGNDGYGIFTTGAITGASFMTGNFISNNKQSGISIEGSSNGLTINNNIVGLPSSGVQGAIIYGNGDAGIRALSTVTSMLIDNNTVCNSGYVNSSTNASTNTGIIFNGATVNSATVSNNYTGIDRSFNLAGNQFPGIYFFSCGTMGGSNVANVLVTGNVVGDNGHYATTPSNGIATYLSNYFTIDNNYVGIGPGGQDIGNVASGIEINTSTNFLITNNNVQNNKGQRLPAVADACAGIIAYTSTTGTIQNNIVSNNLNGGGSFVTNHGIAVQKGGKVLIGGTGANQANTINGNGTHGIIVFDGADNVQMTRNIITCNTSMGISLNVTGDPNTITGGTHSTGNPGMITGPTLATTGCPGAGVAGSGNASGTSPGTNSTIEIFNTPACKLPCPNGGLRGEAQSYEETVTAVGTAWTATGVTGNVSVTATNTVGSGGFFPTSRFSDCQVCSLPITLLYFNGANENNVNVLNWATTTELNNKEFVVERSENGNNFYAIGTTAGAGNSSSLQTYSFSDENTLPEILYYRLKQIDFDGTESYSRIIAISDHQAGGITVFPNPVQNSINILLHGAEIRGTATVNVYNVLGQIVLTRAIATQDLYSPVSIPASSLAKGTYTLKVSTTDQEWIEQLIKE